MKKTWLEQQSAAGRFRSAASLCFSSLRIFAGILVTIITIVASRHSDVYKQAIAQAATNPQVREQIGEPIKPDVAYFRATQCQRQ